MSPELMLDAERACATVEEAGAELSPLGEEVRRGLSAQPRTLSPYLFYDAEGSRLFDAITLQPEYYLTRAERSIFEAHAEEIVALASDGERLSVLELGAGSAAKTGVLLRAAVQAQGSVVYQPVDVSASALEAAQQNLERELPGVTVTPLVGDYTNGYGDLPRPPGRRMALYIGSSIGNFEPEDAHGVLAALRMELLPGDSLLLGTDLKKDISTLLRAYDDAAGVTAAFNRNVLERMRRELASDVRPESFRHEARWNEAHSRIEMHLVSEARQVVAVPAIGMAFEFARGESIHTENSYKYSPEAVQRMLERAGFLLQRAWRDAEDRFQVSLARVE